MNNLLTGLTMNVTGGIMVTLFASWLGWQAWRKREKLLLSYTITESDFFPFHNGQGKYYAIKISNNGGKQIKNITAVINISDGEIDQVTKHELISGLEKEASQTKFKIDNLNPTEEIDFVITSKVTGTSKPNIKIRGEGVNALEKTYSPSTVDVVGTAIIFTAIGFLSTLFVAGALSYEKNPTADQIDKIFSSLSRAGIPHVFHQIIEEHDELSYKETSFYLLGLYLKDTVNGEKYVAALKNFTEVDNIAINSKGVAYYLIYKIDLRRKKVIEADEYLNKCKDETSEMYNFLSQHDRYYNLDSLQIHLLKDK